METPKSPEGVLDSPEKDKPVRWIQIHQQKGNFFRVVHADGVWFSVNPDRLLHLTFYSERFPIPKSIFLSVNKAGTVQGEDVEKREALKDWVREMEVDVVLSISAAKALREGLNTWIKFAEQS